MKAIHTRKAILVSALLFGFPSLPGAVYAQSSPVSSSLYYEIGGGALVNQPLNANVSSPLLSIDAEFRIPTMCELWDSKHLQDPLTYLSLVRDYAEGRLDQLSTAITGYLIDAPTAILIAALQRALPGLYDYSQNLKAQLDAEITYAKKSCQQVVDDIDAGNNPWAGWIKASTGAEWSSTLLSTPGAPPNILAAEEQVRENHSNASIEWFGGKKGGKNGTDAAEPIKLVADVTSAGYAANYGQPYNGTPYTAPTTEYSNNAIGVGNTVTAVPRLNKLWNSSGAAAAFATRVLGEQEISYCLDGCAGSMKPGLGLKPEYQVEFEALVTAWTTLLDDHSIAEPPPLSDLESVSSNKVKITKQVFQYLYAQDTQDRNVYIYRLISDVAVDRTIERALALRQLLKAGHRTPEVRAYRVASTEVQELIDTLKTEIDDLAWEISTQDQLASKTASRLLAAQTLETLSGAATTFGNAGPKQRVNVQNGRANESP